MNSGKTLACFVVLYSTLGWTQSQFKVLWSFGSTNDGSKPVSNLILDSAGNLYGTTPFGGSASACSSIGGCGVVFELSPQSDGSWTEMILYNFCSSFNGSICLDGQSPEAGLLFDSSGNIYGTTRAGGTQPCPIGGCGIVFELSPPSSQGGQWTESVLYTFCANQSTSCPDGRAPTSQLVMDAVGNLYGTTSQGGSGHDGSNAGGGTVFELQRTGGGWAETVLYNFCSQGQGSACPDGSLPDAGVTFDRSGNLYGTTQVGGSNHSTGAGTLFRLSPGSSGWSETVIYAANYNAGITPMGAVSVDSLGNLYSTASAGGPKGLGSVFRFRQGTSGGTDFGFGGTDGEAPQAGVLLDSKHSALYGTTSVGGTGFGDVFAMEAPAKETVLYTFCSQPNCVDGNDPMASLVEDSSGNLYGTTRLGGTNNKGIVFEIFQSFPANRRKRQHSDNQIILPAK